MKRVAVGFLAIIFAAMLLSFVYVVASGYLPHEDPARAEGALDAYSFLIYYSDILNLVSSKAYENASRLIEQLKRVSVPEDLRYVIDKYNNLTLELSGVLDRLEKLLDKASALLYQYRLDEASQTLDEAGILISKAEIILKDLERATATLSERLGVFAASAEGKVREAYDRLQAILNRLRELLDGYYQLLASMDKASETQRQELKPTQVTLNLNTTKILVGGYADAFGTLRSNGQNMLNRTVTVFLDEEPVATAKTDFDGSYHALVRIPYKYVQTMTAKALYTPIGDDESVYLASLSPLLSIEAMFNKTKLSATAPSEAYPGLPMTVGGEVTSEYGVPLGERRVKVLSGGVLLAQAETSVQGIFETQTTPSAETPLGERNLTIVVEPKESYAEASENIRLNIVKIPSEIDIRAPLFVILPTGIYVEGRVNSTLGPLREAMITLEFGQSSFIVNASENGEFNATLNTPLNLIFAGFQELGVKVKPAEPWHASAQAKATVFVVNPVNIGLTSAAFVSLGAVIYTRISRLKPNRGKSKISDAASASYRPVAVVLPLRPAVKFEDARGRVLEAYVRAMKTVELWTEISTKPNMTLREFLSETEQKLEGAVDSFRDLTILAERTLYSPYMPEMEEVVKAESLAIKVEEALKVGDA